jgi:5-methylcytosine-specific restriction endonuclease McrA
VNACSECGNIEKLTLGLCKKHYDHRRYALKKYGDASACAPRGECSRPDCRTQITLSKNSSGLCQAHLVLSWKRAHPQKVSSWNADRRAMKKGQFVERVFRSVVFRRDAGICGICGLVVDPDNWHLDHVIPLAQGGEHSYVNTQVSHPACNIKKGAKIY